MEAAFPGVIHDAACSFRDFVANTRTCKLYDFDEGRWLSYAEAPGCRAERSRLTDAPLSPDGLDCRLRGGGLSWNPTRTWTRQSLVGHFPSFHQRRWR